MAQGHPPQLPLKHRPSLGLPLPRRVAASLVHVVRQRQRTELQRSDQMHPSFVRLLPCFAVGERFPDVHKEHHHEGTGVEAQLVVVPQRPRLE